MYIQLYGPPGEYAIRFILNRVVLDEFDDEQMLPLREWGPWIAPITGIDFVETHAYPLPKVQFVGPGFYEFHLWAQGVDEPLATERVYVHPLIPELP